MLLLRSTVTYYRRNLPHWLPDGSAIFLTWRLHASLPAVFFERLAAREELSDEEKFDSAEDFLDHPTSGPVWLKDPRIAACVVERLQKGACELSQYNLHAYAVMANHVHALLTPTIEVRWLTKGLKGTTARIANRILNRTGERFWQDESFDHWVRDEAQFARFKNYIEANPVKAGLVASPQDWRWSSAYCRAQKQEHPEVHRQEWLCYLRQRRRAGGTPALHGQK